MSDFLNHTIFEVDVTRGPLAIVGIPFGRIEFNHLEDVDRTHLTMVSVWNRLVKTCGNSSFFYRNFFKILCPRVVNLKQLARW